MSVRDYPVLWLGATKGSGNVATAGGGNVLLKTASHHLDGPEHLVASDATTLDATITEHGLLPKLSGNAYDFINGLGAWGRAGTANGGPVSIRYTFDTTTTDSDPGSGKLRLSNATQSSAVTVRADLADLDGSDVTALLAIMSSGYLRLQKADDPSKWLVATVSAVASPSGYKNITIANIAKSANSPFANSDVIVLSFIPSSGGSALTVEESDGSPTDSAITKIKFPNGTLSISSHEATYTPTAAAITIQEEDGSPTGSLTTLKVPNNSLVDNGGGSFSLRQAPQGFIGCRAYNSAAQSIANNSAVAATFDSEEYDTDGFHDTGSNTSRFTVPAGLGGKYLVNFKGYWDSLVSPSGGSSDAIIWFAKKNGTTEIRGRSRIDQTFPTGSASSVVMDLTAVIDLAAGDYIEFIVFQNHGSSANLGDNTVYQTTGEIVKLDSGRVGQGIGAVAYNSAAQAIPTATTTALTMDSEESDTDGFHSTGSNTARMTIPTGLGGRYIVTAGTYFAGNATGQRILALRKNGTTDIRGSLSRIPTSHATNGSGMNVSRVVDLVAGDYVEAVVYQDSGGNLDAGFASTNTAQSYIGIARLDSGSAAYTGALWGSGTAFPSGPVSGQRYTRTDIYGGMDFQYDGTRWRSIQVFQSAIIQENLLSWTIDAQRWRFPLFQPTYSVWLIEMRGDTVTATTNDGSHYWTVKLAKGSDNTTIVSFTTAADTVNAEANHLVAIGAVSTEKHLYVQGDRTSTPGPLYPFIVVLYQIIAT